MVLAFITLGKVWFGFVGADFYDPALDGAGDDVGATTLLGTLEDFAPIRTRAMNPLPAGELFLFFRVARGSLAFKQFCVPDIVFRELAKMAPRKKVRVATRDVYGGHSRIIQGPDCWGFVEPGGVLPPEGAVEPGELLPPEDGVEPGAVEPGAVLPPEDGVDPDEGAGGGVQPCVHGSK